MYGKARCIGLAVLILFPVLLFCLSCINGASPEEYNKLTGDRAQSAITRLEEEKAGLETQLSEAQGRVATLLQENASLAREKASMQQEIADLEAQETKVSQLEEAKSSLQEQVSSLEEQLAALTIEAEKVSELQEQIDSLESQVETLKAAKASLETEAEKVSALEEKIEGLEAAKANLEAQISALQEEKASLEARVAQLEPFALKASPSVAVTFEGSGVIATEPFVVESSLWKLEWEVVSGYSSDFEVTLRDAGTGEAIKLLVYDRVGVYGSVLSQTGSTWVIGDVGTFYLDVTGPVQPSTWTVRVVVPAS